MSEQPVARVSAHAPLFARARRLGRRRWRVRLSRATLHLHALTFRLVRQYPGRTGEQLASLAQLHDFADAVVRPIEWYRARVGLRLEELERRLRVYCVRVTIHPGGLREVTWFPIEARRG